MQPPLTRSPARSLQALLGKALDYAGMFPPASLGLEDAIRNYAGYRSGPGAWFLSHFICPAHQLAALGSRLAQFTQPEPVGVSVLGLPSRGPDDFIPRLAESLRLVAEFHYACATNARVHAIELAVLPDVIGSDAKAIRDLISATAGSLERSGLPPITPFFEVTGQGNREDAARSTIQAVAEHNGQRRGSGSSPAAFKLRTGGVTSGAFPSVEQVAAVISSCRNHDVRFKCTAGLHHPIRRYHESVETEMHGFLNLFAAAVLAHARSVSSGDIRAILADTDASHFRFHDDGLTWQEERATIAEIAEARRRLILSFGSCSFDEPLEDLRGLGLL